MVQLGTHIPTLNRIELSTHIGPGCQELRSWHDSRVTDGTSF